jgi:hypothetical protein
MILVSSGLQIEVRAGTTGEAGETKTVKETWKMTKYGVYNACPSADAVQDYRSRWGNPGDPHDETAGWGDPTTITKWIPNSRAHSRVHPKGPDFSHSEPYKRADGKWVVRYRYTYVEETTYSEKP